MVCTSWAWLFLYLSVVFVRLEICGGKEQKEGNPSKLGLRSHHKSHNSVLIQNMDLCLDSVICLDPAYSCGISYTHEVLHMF